MASLHVCSWPVMVPDSHPTSMNNAQQPASKPFTSQYARSPEIIAT